MLSITSATSSRFKSTTTRIPSRSLSSRTSEMPSIFLSLTRPAIDSSRRVLFTM